MPGEHAGAAQPALGVSILGRASLRRMRVQLSWEGGTTTGDMLGFADLMIEGCGQDFPVQ